MRRQETPSPLLGALGLAEVAGEVIRGPDRQIQRRPRTGQHVAAQHAAHEHCLAGSRAEGARAQPPPRQQQLHLGDARAPEQVYIWGVFTVFPLEVLIHTALDQHH